MDSNAKHESSVDSDITYVYLLNFCLLAINITQVDCLCLCVITCSLH